MVLLHPLVILYKYLVGWTSYHLALSSWLGPLVIPSSSLGSSDLPSSRLLSRRVGSSDLGSFFVASLADSSLVET